MANFPADSVFICEAAQVSTDNPITHRYRFLLLTLVVERKSGVIVDAEINSICNLTTKFVQDLMIGYSLRIDLQHIIDDIRSRYYGESSKSLVYALNACAKKFLLLYPLSDTTKPNLR